MFGNANGLSKARHLEAEGITVAGGVQVLLYGYMIKTGLLSSSLTPIVQSTHGSEKKYMSVYSRLIAAINISHI